MTEVSCQESISGNSDINYLFRFINPDLPQGTWFDLKDGKPPETYVSFFSGIGTERSNRVCDAIHKAIGRYTPSASGNAAEMFVPKVLETVNRRKLIIDFHAAGEPHYGMTYVSQELRDIVFAKTLLCSMAESNITNYGHCESLTASLEHKKAMRKKLKLKKMNQNKSGNSGSEN